MSPARANRAEEWEKVVRKASHGCHAALERAAAFRPGSKPRWSRGWSRRSTQPPRRIRNPGRTDTLRRLNRTEYSERHQRSSVP